ncbi:MAG: PIN domain-containing protein [Alphaproteobacteria bacterium]|nr:PIN domain-containing protein [Alphaproteobacteria bacterium]
MIPVLLDTQALIWLANEDPQLRPISYQLSVLAWRNSGLYVSAISFWECALAARRGRVRLHCPVHDWRDALLSRGLKEIPVDGRIGISADGLTNLHRDPADRIIVATSLILGACLITSDAEILKWSGQLSRQNARL